MKTHLNIKHNKKRWKHISFLLSDILSTLYEAILWFYYIFDQNMWSDQYYFNVFKDSILKSIKNDLLHTFNRHTVCPGSSSAPFYIVPYYIKMVTTSWTYSIREPVQPTLLVFLFSLDAHIVHRNLGGLQYAHNTIHRVFRQ